MSVTSAQLIAAKTASQFTTGSAGSPSIAFSGDTSTGIYSPGTGQLALATNGTHRLRIDSSGNLLVGTTSTSALATANRGLLELNGTNDCVYSYKASDSLLGYSLGTTSEIRLAAYAAIPLTFYTSNTERLRITSGGLVGIGVSNPQQSIETSGSIRLSSGGSRVVEFLQNVNAAAYTGPGFYSQSSLGYGVGSGGTHRWIGIDGNTEMMRLTSTGLGIGTTSPSATLQVSPSSGSANFQVSRGSKGLQINQDSDTADPNINAIGTTAIKFLRDGSESARIDTSGRLLVGTSSDPTYGGFASPKLYIKQSTDTGVGTGFHLEASGDTSVMYAGYNGTGFEFGTSYRSTGSYKPLIFSPGGAERMRISISGDIAMYSNNYPLVVATNQGAGTVYQLITGRRSATSVLTGTDVFYVHSNGNVQNTNGSYTTISDAKLKENIVDAKSQWNDLKAIRIRNWNFKEDTGHETHRQIGPIAQELEEVCPGLVFETPDRDEEGIETGEVTKGVNQSVLYMKAVKALQEAMERIEQLEAEMAEVKAQLS